MFCGSPGFSLLAFGSCTWEGPIYDTTRRRMNDNRKRRASKRGARPLVGCGGRFLPARHPPLSSRQERGRCLPCRLPPRCNGCFTFILHQCFIFLLQNLFISFKPRTHFPAILKPYQTEPLLPPSASPSGEFIYSFFHTPPSLSGAAHSGLRPFFLQILFRPSCIFRLLGVE